MCGIIVYYGDAENRISRLLNGMWGIVYRAPDSTGLGLIGSDLEPLKIRREMGSFEPLIDRLIDCPVFDEGELRIVSVLDDNYQNYSNFIVENQNKLLKYEGFSLSAEQSAGARTAYPRWSELFNTAQVNEVAPGTAGSSDIQEYFTIDSAASLKQIVGKLLLDYDLPMGLVEKLICRGFEEQLKARDLQRPESITTEHLLDELKSIVYRYARTKPLQNIKTGDRAGLRNPQVRKYVWLYLKNVVVMLPADFTTDGIANLFRSIDSSVLALTVPYPEIDDAVQKIFENFWSENKTSPPVHWRSLYRSEKLYNVYGIAAAAALTFFQTEIYMKQMLANRDVGKLPPGHIPGRTHPLLLKSMIQPVIGQGRWAIQSAISVRNSHPFMDEKKFRAVVLNGMFSSDIESRLAEYLTKAAGIKLRSTNSTELFSLLWGYYFETFFNAGYRYKVIEEQIGLGLEDFAVGSLSVDYGIFNTLRTKTVHELDEMAFKHACEVMLKGGGQFAVAGISLVSPDRLFIATHKRPVYIVRRPDNSDYMVVSDVNAAIGLFPQSLIQPASQELSRLMDEYSKRSLIVETDFFDDRSDSREAWFKREKMALLEPFRVEIFALDMERVFARVKTKVGTDNIVRELEISDFSGKIRRDIQPEQSLLSPVAYKKEFGRTYYEEHLLEIPTLLEEILARCTVEETNAPRFEIKTRLLQRRFGADLSSLNRIILVGTGTSHFLAEIIEKNMERFFTGVNILEAKTHEFDNIDIDLNPDRDLVIVISWSGSTFEVVDFATRLLKKKILMVGITEKPFSDLALIARKSCGIIPVYSGEEVTVVATKSAVCMLFTMYLFCLYLSSLQRSNRDGLVADIKAMRQLPDLIRKLLDNEKVVQFCRETAAENQQGKFHYLIGCLHDVGSERAASMNLEINSWTSMGVSLDFSELEGGDWDCFRAGDLVLVNATNRTRLKQSIQLMSSLSREGVRFYCITYKNREKLEIEGYAAGTVLLPKVLDHLQPFIDLPFMFLFGLYYGLARGRLASELPRNLAKSVTAGRARDKRQIDLSDLYATLEKQNATARLFADLPPASAELPGWIQEGRHEQEKEYYRQLIQLCSYFYTEDPFGEFFHEPSLGGIVKLSERIHGQLAEDGVLIFVPLDKKAEGGCRNFTRIWSRFFSLPMQLEFPEKLQGVSTENSILVVVASSPPDVAYLESMRQFKRQSVVWLGPECDGAAQLLPAEPGSCYFFKGAGEASGHEAVYFGLSLFFAQVIAYKSQQLTELLAEHFTLFLPAVKTLLSDERVRFNLERVMQENRSYRKRIFITGSRGTCSFIRQLFHLQGGAQLEGETFGVSVYSHLVLVDPVVKNKYVALESRVRLVTRYSEKQVRMWEMRYLNGENVDRFLEGATALSPLTTVEPFMYGDIWYLPVLRPDYDVNNDCLVIIDATSEIHFDVALDELATFGSRYARLVVLAQQPFAADSRLATLKKYPLSEIIYLPGLQGKNGEVCAYSDYIMPVLLNIVTTSMYYSS